MLNVGDKAIDNDKNSLYFGREVIITGITYFSNCVVFTVVYDDNIHYALKEDTLKEIG